MKYLNYSKAPEDKEIWGCGYSTNGTEKSMALMKKPVKGKIIGRCFYELKKNGDIKESSKVYYTSRQYADTEEECIEIYNEKVQYQIDFLEGLIQKCRKDLI